MKKKIAVIGAGIAGLTCAYELQKAGHEVTVYEKESFVGGRMSSRTKDGFIFDLGADHLCNLYDEMKSYCKEFGIEWEKMRFLEYRMVKNQQLIPIYHSISWISRLRLAYLFFKTRNIGNFFNLNTLVDLDTDNAHDYMKKHVGQDAADYIADPFTSTYQFHLADEISLSAFLGILYSIKKDKEKWHLHRTKGGMQALPDAFAKRLNVKLNTPVNSVESIDGKVKVKIDSKEEEFDAVVFGCQATAVNRILQGSALKRDVMLAGSKYASSMSVAFKVSVDKLPNAAIFWVPFKESEIISGFVNEAMKGEETVKEGKTLLSVWLHEKYAREMMNEPDEVIFQEVEEELRRLNSWLAGVETAHHDLHRWPEAMPKFAQGHITRVKEFLDEEQGKNGIYLCGDYLNSPWTEGALRCGQRVAKKLNS